MALYRLGLKSFSRKASGSMVRRAAYRSGEALHDESDGLLKSYKGKRAEVVADEIIGTDESREALWNRVERSVTRRNGVTGYELLATLPHELGVERNWQVARDFAHALHERFGVIVDVCMHQPRKGDERHRDGGHAHVLLTPMRADGSRFGDFQTNGLRAVHEVRGMLAGIVNRALAESGEGARVDHRSARRRGAEAAPSGHLPRGAWYVEQRGEPTDVGDWVRGRRRRHRDRRRRAAVEATIAAAPAAAAHQVRAHLEQRDRWEARDEYDRTGTAAQLARRAREGRRAVGEPGGTVTPPGAPIVAPSPRGARARGVPPATPTPAPAPAVPRPSAPEAPEPPTGGATLAGRPAG